MRRPTELCDGSNAGFGRDSFLTTLLANPARRRAVIAFGLGVSMTGVLACGGNDDRPSADGDAGMSDSRPMIEAPGQPSMCTSGLCTSQACTSAEQLDLARGCRFYAVQMDNIDSDDGKNMMLVLTNGSSETPANFRIELRSPDGWELVAPQDVIATGQTARFEINRPILDPGLAPYAAFRITSDSPILAVQIVSDDSDRMSNSSSGTVLLPAHALGQAYMAMTFSQIDSEATMSTPGGRGAAGTITIVATADGTNVHLSPTTSTLVMAGTTYVPGASPDDLDLQLNEGDVWQVFSDTPGGDLSGTVITADHPVEVFSGNVFTTYGFEPYDFNGGDMAIEAMPPLSAWSQDYVGARLSPQDGCKPYFGDVGGLWQVLAAEDGTTVTISASPNTDLVVNNADMNQKTMFRLNRGKSMMFSTTPDPNWDGTGAPPTGDFVLKASNPVLLGQWLDCEPGLSLGMDTRFGPSTDLSFAFPLGYDQQVVIARRAGTPVQIDGQTIPPAFFQPASGDNDYEVARLTADQFGPCLDALDVQACQHRLTSLITGVAVGWRGADIVCSYALTVPPSYPCVQPLPGCVQ